MIGKIIEAIPKMADVIRNAFKDRADKKISYAELEQLAVMFDENNRLEWDKWSAQKPKIYWETKLLEQENLKKKLSFSLFKVDDKLTVDISDVRQIEIYSSYALIFYKNFLFEEYKRHLNGGPGKTVPIYHRRITVEQAKIIQDKLNEFSL